MAEEKKIATGYIGNALRSAADNHTTTFSDEIFDTERQKYQNEVNTDLETTDNEIKADIEAETARAKAAEKAIIFDVSAHNNGTVFESIQALLSSSNLSTLIPVSFRHGGMTIRYVQTSDNKYVQYRLMATSFSTDEANWQGVDEQPTAGSDNLVKSGGVANKLAELEVEIGKIEAAVLVWTDGKFVLYETGNISTYEHYSCSDYIAINGVCRITTNAWAGGNAGYAIYDNNYNYITGEVLGENSENKHIVINDNNACFIRVSNFHTRQDNSNVFLNIAYGNEDSISKKIIELKHTINDNYQQLKTKTESLDTSIIAGKRYAVVENVDYLVSEDTLTSATRGAIKSDGSITNSIELGYIHRIYNTYVQASTGSTSNNNPIYIDCTLVNSFDPSWTNIVIYNKNDEIVSVTPILNNINNVIAIGKGFYADICCNESTISISRNVVSKNLDAKIKKNSDAIKNLRNIVGEHAEAVLVWTDGKFVLYETGDTSTYEHYSCSDYIAINGVCRITTNAWAGGNAGYALYDESMKYLYGAILGEDNTEKSIVVNDERVAYLRLSNFRTRNPNENVYCNIEIGREDSIYNQLQQNKNTIGNIDSLTTDNKSNIVNAINEVDNRINTVISLNKSVATFRETPIVTFVYDDGVQRDDILVQWLKERGLKASFALFGHSDVNSAVWKSTTERYSQYIKEGHSVLVHGVCSGVSVTKLDNTGYNGLGHISDKDSAITLESTIHSFIKSGFPTNGFVNFNGGNINHHVRTIISRYFDFVVDWDKKNGMNYANEDMYYISRYITDSSNMLSNAKKLVDTAIGKNCLIVFGGHMAQTGTGGSHSSENDFLALLDYVADKVNNGLMVAMNCNEAVNQLYSQGNTKGIVRSITSNGGNPMRGEQVIVGNTVKVCKDTGQKAIFKIELSGADVSDGNISIRVGGETNSTDISTGQIVTVNVSSGESLADIAKKFETKCLYSCYTVRASGSSIMFYRDLVGTTFDIVVIDNSCGVGVTVTKVTNGEEPTYL